MDGYRTHPLLASPLPSSGPVSRSPRVPVGPHSRSVELTLRFASACAYYPARSRLTWFREVGEERAQVMVNHCKALAAQGQGSHVDAYDALVTTISLFLKVFRAAESPWVMAPLYALVFNLRAAAERADDDLRRQNKPLSKLSDAGSQLMRCFRECLTVRARARRICSGARSVRECYGES